VLCRLPLSMVYKIGGTICKLLRNIFGIVHAAKRNSGKKYCELAQCAVRRFKETVLRYDKMRRLYTFGLGCGIHARPPLPFELSVHDICVPDFEVNV
jgi:hypothetical protein